VRISHDLGVQQAHHDSDFYQLFDLRQNNNLLHLCIYDIWIEEGSATLLGNLSQMASFNLETIYLRVAFTSVETVEWHQVAQVLTRPQFAKLHKVRLDVIRYGESYANWVDYICPLMSILGDILHVSVVQN